MSTIYTEYLSKLPTDGSQPDEALALRVLARLRLDLRRQLKRRGLWILSPALLGISGSFWDDATLEELVHECYIYVFGERLKNLLPQLKHRDNVDGLVVLNLKHFLTRLQRETDPVGYRVYEILGSAIDKAVRAGDVFVLSDDDRIRNDTILGFSPRTDPRRAAAFSELEALVSIWNENLLPDLITARSRAVTKVIDHVRDCVLALRAEDVEAFRFGDVVQPLKRDVRRRWASVWDLDAGESAAELDEAGVAAMVRVVRPDDYGDGRGLEWLLECVPNSIHLRQDDSAKNREGLWKLWEYVCGFTLGSDPSRGGRKLPSFSALGELLDIYRERIPRLLKVLRALVEACRAREGHPATEATLTDAGRREPAQWPQNDKQIPQRDAERRATP